ncbi:MAG TPA: hypothetical protein PLO78_01860 [Candidatus Omnitrophota bacterium]|nr:hypothetical protein [Candidatus Omnitrophota bacterium]
MTFQELLQAIKSFKNEENRAFTDDYLEVVIAKSKIQQYQTVLETFFGLPLKPEGQAPSPEANLHAKAYGGIHDNQTMYLRKDNGTTALAFLWPWGNGSLVTLKVFSEK